MWEQTAMLLKIRPKSSFTSLQSRQKKTSGKVGQLNYCSTISSLIIKDVWGYGCEWTMYERLTDGNTKWNQKFTR